MRTDDDTWDITTSVGSTALFVASARALEARKPDPLVIDEYAEVFCRTVGGHWSEVLDGSTTASKLTGEFGAHFVNFQAARTHFFDSYFQAAVASGVRQMVILAAGLDSRAYRLDWPDETVIYELDQPKVLDFKREVLTRRGDQPNAERREIAVDLRSDWPQALKDNGFRPGQPAAFLAEGLLMYLPAGTQEQLFTGIDALAASGSFTAIEEGEPMPPQAFEAAKRAERAAGTDGTFFTLIYNQMFAPAAEWFGAHGWSAQRTPLSELLAGLQRPLPEPGTEAFPMVQSNSLVSAVKN
ncbi:SAM-dependent methyltransferase [Mycobacterium sp. NBC_00419]|uniref:SAM-dependent methyltransferase n=1 Tax=Mycobacterium sp. NBC_00419 TaxID=2975989 RepID=UPI002E2216F5